MESTHGIVIIRNILSIEDQIKLIDIVERKGGLKDKDDKWNFFDKRGRCFSSLCNYPSEDSKFILDLCAKFKSQAENLDKTLIWKDVTHLLTLWYPDENGMGWHVDGFGGNDGDEGAPVYSLTLGNTCVFQYKLVGTKKAISVELCSGDLIVFGGPQRLMPHSVKKVISDSCKTIPGINARINLTFRTCSDLTHEMEEKYQTNNYVETLRERWNKK